MDKLLKGSQTIRSKKTMPTTIFDIELETADRPKKTKIGFGNVLQNRIHALTRNDQAAKKARSVLAPKEPTKGQRTDRKNKENFERQEQNKTGLPNDVSKDELKHATEVSEEMTITKVGAHKEDSAAMQKQAPRPRSKNKSSIVHILEADSAEISRQIQLEQALSAATLNTLILSPREVPVLNEKAFNSPNFATSGKHGSTVVSPTVNRK